YQSLDAGRSWDLITGMLFPTDPNTGNIQAGSSPIDLNSFVGARVTKVVVDDNTSLGFNGRVYVCVASGGHGPGIYKSLDGGQTWNLALTPANMLLANGTTTLASVGISALPSATDFMIDRLSFDDENLWVGLGNVGLVNPTAG